MTAHRGDDFTAKAATLLEEAVAQRVTPGAVLQVSTREASLPPIAVGARAYGSKATTADTFYDLASLTKVVGCLPLLLHLVDAGEIRLGDPVSRFFSNAGWFQEPSLGDVTLEDLTLHRSGMPAWRPVYANVSRRLTAVANVLQTHLSEEPGRYIYSDLGLMVLGAVIERVMGERLDSAFQRVVAAPLEATSITYAPLPQGAAAAPTEDDGLRGLLVGQVHDENAWVMDGVSAHAGLFGTASDVSRYAAAWLRLEAPFASPATMADALRDRSAGSGPARGLLWRLNDAEQWPLGAGISRQAFGHTGFTGTSIVVDPEAGWACVLLTNRVHPRRGDAGPVARLRRSVHELVAASFGAPA